MSEEQFWKSNPRIIKVWEKAFRETQNFENYKNYVLGYYVQSAVASVIASAFSGKHKSNVKYIEKPVRLFEMTEEEEKAEQRKALEGVVAFFNMTESDAKQEGMDNGRSDD